MNHYRILVHSHPEGPPSCTLVEVLYNRDGSVAKAMEPVFAGMSPDEIVHDLGAALAQASCCTLLKPEDVVGYADSEPIPF